MFFRGHNNEYTCSICNSMDDSWDMSGPRINVGCKGEGVMLMSYDGGIGNACDGGGAGDDGKIDEFVHGNWRLLWL